MTQTRSVTSGVVVLLLGEVEALRRSRPIPIPGLKLQALLAILALESPHPVSDDRLIDELWGDHHLSNAANSLHSQIAVLRRALGRDIVARVGHGYALSVDADDVDALRFARLVGRSRQLAREGDQRSAAQGFQTAIALVRGPPLRDLIDYPFAHAAATRLENLLLEAHEGLADAELSSGKHAELVGPLTELVRLYPLREHFHAQLILALYRCGRQADALRAYRVARDTLVDELGVEPGPELRELEFAVLSHDERLAAPVGEPPPPAAMADDATGSATTPATWDRPPLVGRAGELDHLRSDLEDVFAGRGRMTLLAGEPGIGKTRLAEELAAQATSRGALVVWGQCYSGRGAPAFWPWTQTIRTLVEHLPADVVTTALGRGAAEIGRLVPEVRDLVPDLESLPPLDPEYERFRLCDALTRFLIRLAAKRPIVIVLEDLHWADASSLELLTFLAGAVVEAPLLIVASYRNVGVAGRGRLVGTLGDLARQPVVRQLDVIGLDQEAVRQLMLATGHPASDELVGPVYRRTQGNPFFLVETLRLRSAAGAEPDLTSVPTGVREVIRQRLGLLPVETVDATNAASVLGLDFELSILASTVDLDPTGCLLRLEPAIDAGLVVSHDGPSRFRFSHVLVRDTLYEDLSVATRARLHQRAASALEAAYGQVGGAHLMRVAEHWFNAIPAATPDRAVQVAVRAARWAKEHVAHEQAEEQLRAALVLLGALPEGRHRAELELELQYELSALLITTTGYATSGVERVCARMLDLCGSIDDEILLMPALWRLAIFYLFVDELDTAVAIGERLLALGGPSADPVPQLAGNMMLGLLHSHRGDLMVARRHLDLADDLYHGAEDSLVADFVAETPAVWIAMFSAWNWSLLGDPERAKRGALDAIDLASGLADRTNTFALTFAYWVASLVATLQRDMASTRRCCEEGIAIANAGGFGMEFVPFMTAHAGWAEAVTGDFETGVAEIIAGASAVRASGARMWQHVFAALLADAHVTNGRFVEGLAQAEDGLGQLRATGARWLEAELHRLRGEALVGIDSSDPEAAEEFARAVAIAERQGAAVLQQRAEASLANVVDT